MIIFFVDDFANGYFVELENFEQHWRCYSCLCIKIENSRMSILNYYFDSVLISFPFSFALADLHSPEFKFPFKSCLYVLSIK